MGQQQKVQVVELNRPVDQHKKLNILWYLALMVGYSQASNCQVFLYWLSQMYTKKT